MLLLALRNVSPPF